MVPLDARFATQRVKLLNLERAIAAVTRTSSTRAPQYEQQTRSEMMLC